VVLCACATVPLYAQDLIVIVSGEDPRLQSIARIIEQGLEPVTPRVLHLSGTQLEPGRLPADADLIISIGNEASTIALAQRSTQPMLCALVSESTYRQALRERYGSVAAGLEAGVSGLYFEQPPERQFRLARLLVPEAKVAGLALGPVLQEQRSQLIDIASQQGLELITVPVSADANPVKILDPLVRRTDLLLALPDKAHWHSQTAKWLLYLSYQRSKPIIAFSARYTDAGAVASLHSRRADIAEQAAAIALAMLKKPDPGSIYWPERFHVSTNPSVARALGLRLLDGAEYERRIRGAEVEP
jgi:ABC-type uncharacterized transport system substrate-binding protein